MNDADGSPLGTTRISLVLVLDRRKAESIVTGADGRFEFSNVPAGKFSLEGARRNFLMTTYQWHEGFSTAIVTGAGFDTEHLVLRMIPFGSIAGKVIDEAGEPVRYADVKLYMRNQQFGQDRVVTHGFSRTDDEGKYEFPQLIPGEYFVSATARPWYAVYPIWADENGVKTRVDTVAPELNVAYPTIFYNGVAEPESATPISLEKGARVVADIHLNPVSALHVTVKMQVNPGEGNTRMPTLEKMEFDTPEFVRIEGGSGASPDEMEINGLAPGRYAIGGQGGSQVLPAASQVEVTKDGQVLEMKAPESMATVKVKVKTARGEDVPEGTSLNLRNEHRRTIAFLPVKADGTVDFEGVPAGKYTVLVNSQKPPQYTIGRMTLLGAQGAQATEVEGNDFAVGEGSTLEINATLMAGIVSVEGVVMKKGKPVPGAMVALVPKDPRRHPERFRRDQSDMDGTFMVGGILPGTYTLIAVEDAWGFAWMKEGVLEKYLPHGQQVNIGVMMNGKVMLPDPLEAQAR